MLIGIKPCISPDLLSVLFRMGHGDEIVLADAFFTGDALNPRVVRADGIRIPDLLDGILRLINLDDFVDATVIMMQPTHGDTIDPEVERIYREAIDRHWPIRRAIARMERFAFYDADEKKPSPSS